MMKSLRKALLGKNATKVRYLNYGALGLFVACLLYSACMPENIDLPYRLKSVTTKNATKITSSGAILEGNVSVVNSEKVTCGVIYDTASSLTANSGTRISVTSSGDFSIEVSGLKINTTYYYRAYAVDAGEYKYGEIYSFKTESSSTNPNSSISVTTGEAKSITYSSVTLSGAITGANQSLTCGIIYGTSSSISSTSGTKISTTSNGGFSLSVTGLNANTTYYYCAYVIVDGEYKYGAVNSFNTAKTSQDGDVEFKLTYMDPADGAKKTFLNSIYMVFTKDITIAIPEGGIDVVNTATQEVVKITKFFEDEYASEHNSAVFYLDGQLSAGNWTCTIPAGVITSVDNEVFPETTFSFGIVSTFNYTSYSPMETNNLEKIEITFDTEITEVEIPSSGLFLTDLYWTKYFNLKNEVVISEDKKTVTLELVEPITEPGQYFMDLYQGVFVSADGLNANGSLAFDVVAPEIQAVDLGLSVKWASCNVGASSPEEYGDYFAWGETETKSSYNESTSITYDLSISELESRSIIDADGNLTTDYDAATANWGDNWRMPTSDEMEELIVKCTWKWTTQNGVNGYKVTGPNGNSIFLPAAGFRYDTSLYSAGSYGHYWSATPLSDIGYAWFLYFVSGYYDWYYYTRDYGHAVRPVSEE